MTPAPASGGARAARTDRIGRLVLYEPPVDERPAPPDLLRRMRDLLAHGRRDDVVVVLMMREVVLMPEDEIAAVHALPSWPTRVAAAHTLPREMGVPLAVDPAEVAGVTQPTLLLVGGDSPSLVQDENRMLARAPPTSLSSSSPGSSTSPTSSTPRACTAHPRLPRQRAHWEPVTAPYLPPPPK